MKSCGVAKMKAVTQAMMTFIQIRGRRARDSRGFTMTCVIRVHCTVTHSTMQYNTMQYNTMRCNKTQ